MVTEILISQPHGRTIRYISNVLIALVKFAKILHLAQNVNRHYCNVGSGKVCYLCIQQIYEAHATSTISVGMHGTFLSPSRSQLGEVNVANVAANIDAGGAVGTASKLYEASINDLKSYHNELLDN